jgi:hypothetical protein
VIYDINLNDQGKNAHAEHPHFTTAQDQTETENSDNSTDHHYLDTFPSMSPFVADVIPVLDRCRKGINNNANLITALATAIIAVFTWRLWIVGNEQRHAMDTELRISERAYVSIGTLNGTIIDHADGDAAQMYFVNTGHSAAMNFMANIFTGTGWKLPKGGWSFESKGSSGQNYAHIQRYASKSNRGGVGICGGPDIAAGGTYVETLRGLNNLTAARARGDIMSLDVLGSFEYCDEFGTYHCTGFRTQYDPTLNRFFPTDFGSDVGCPIGDISDPDPLNIALPRCPQPGDRETICSHAQY